MIIHIIHTEILVESDQQEALRRHLIALTHGARETDELWTLIDDKGWESYVVNHSGVLEIHTDNDYLELDEVEKFLSDIADYCVMLSVYYSINGQFSLGRYILHEGNLYNEMGEVSFVWQKTIKLSVTKEVKRATLPMPQ